VTLTARCALGEGMADVVGWMAASSGLAPPGATMSAREVLAVFDPAHLRREPTILDPALALADIGAVHAG
jgi:hypothetical protein